MRVILDTEVGYKEIMGEVGDLIKEAKATREEVMWGRLKAYNEKIAVAEKESNAATRANLLHEAEDILMTTGAICPIYYYTDIFMCDDSLENFFTTPLGFKYFMYASVK